MTDKAVFLMFWQSCGLPHLEGVISSDWVHGVGNYPVLLTFLQIYVKIPIMVSSSACKSCSGIWPVPADFSFSVQLLQFKLTHKVSLMDFLLGAECSPELYFLQNSHGCIVLSNILGNGWESLVLMRQTVRSRKKSWVTKDVLNRCDETGIRRRGGTQQ